MRKTGYLRLQSVPEEFKERLVHNLKTLRPFEDWKECFDRNILLSEAFPWPFSEEGWEFWHKVDNGARIDKNDLLDAIIEAKSRGFDDGVYTKFGRVMQSNPETGRTFDHEILLDGTFYFRNIKVRNEKGKWIKPISEKKYRKLVEKQQEPDVAEFEKILKNLFGDSGIRFN